MTDSKKNAAKPKNAATRVAHEGRDPAQNYGFVNTPVYRGSTVVFPTLDSLKTRNQPFTYGRRGTPTTIGLEQSICSLEGGELTILTGSGLQAVTTAILAFVKSGDNILMTDSVYQPTRAFCDHMLKSLGVTTTYYDPMIAAGIAGLIQDNTTLIFTESPGSQTFEVQDIPAITKAAAARDVWVLMDNTWASPLYFDAIGHGVDVSIQSATKYIVGHADAMLGAVTANTKAAKHLNRAKESLGTCPGSEETYLAQRGLRTLDVRLERHNRSGLEMASWLSAREEVATVLHPALPGCPGHEIWKRDFKGASGLFSIVLKPAPEKSLAALVDDLELFGMGYSWGGYESLILPFDPQSSRTATKWTAEGPALRLHIGLEHVDDLKADLDAGFARYNASGRS